MGWGGGWREAGEVAVGQVGVGRGTYGETGWAGVGASSIDVVGVGWMQVMGEGGGRRGGSNRPSTAGGSMPWGEQGRTREDGGAGNRMASVAEGASAQGVAV